MNYNNNLNSDKELSKGEKIVYAISSLIIFICCIIIFCILGTKNIFNMLVLLTFILVTGLATIWSFKQLGKK